MKIKLVARDGIRVARVELPSSMPEVVFWEGRYFARILGVTDKYREVVCMEVDEVTE